MLFQDQPLPLVDSIHKIDKIVQDTHQEIRYITNLLENSNTNRDNTNHYEVSGTVTSSSLHFREQNDFPKKNGFSVTTGGRADDPRKPDHINDKNQEVHALKLRLGRIKLAINQTLLSDELKMWNFILEFCSVYYPKPFHEHECTVECCSEIPELIHTKLNTSFSVTSLSSQFSQTTLESSGGRETRGGGGYSSRLGKTLDVFYNEEDRKFFQSVIIKNYMSDCDYQYFQRNFVIILSKVHRLFGCFPSGRLHMCHPISERRYETCSRTAMICHKSGRAYCSFSGLEISNHWAENVFDYNQAFCSDDNIADMTYVESTVLNQVFEPPSFSSHGSNASSSSSSASKFSKQHNKNNYNVSTTSGVHSSGMRLSSKSGTKYSKGDTSSSTISPTTKKRTTSRYFVLNPDDATTYVSEKVSESPKMSENGSITKLLRTHNSKVKKSELSQFKRDSASKVPSKKMLSKRFGSSSSLPSLPYSGTTATVTTKQSKDEKPDKEASLPDSIVTDFDVLKPHPLKKIRVKKSKPGFSNPLSTSLPLTPFVPNLVTIGKHNLIRELIEYKRAETRINSSISHEQRDLSRPSTLRDTETATRHDDSFMKTRGNGGTSSQSKLKFLYFSHFWNEKGLAYFTTLKKTVDSIKHSCLLLYWKQLFLDEIDQLFHQINDKEDVTDNLLKVLDCQRLDISLFKRESDKFFSTICLLIPKIYNMRESLKVHEHSDFSSSLSYSYSKDHSVNTNEHCDGRYLESTNDKHSRGSFGQIFSSAKTWNNTCFLLGLCSVVKEGIVINNCQVIGGINYPFFPDNANKFAVTFADIDREFADKITRLLQQNIAYGSSSQHSPYFREELQNRTNSINSRAISVRDSLRKIITDIPKNSLFYNTVSTNAKSSRPEYRKKLNKGNKQIRYLLQQCDVPAPDLRKILYEPNLKLDVLY